jgi:hypothetical protein
MSLLGGWSARLNLKRFYFLYMEIWKDIPGYEGMYQVSNLGNVKSLSRVLRNKYNTFVSKEKLLTPKIASTKYYFVKLCKNGEKSFAVHRLVMMAFSGVSDLDVNHKDLNKLNNNLENLEYCTRKENVYHYEQHQKRISKYIGVSYDKRRSHWVAKYKKQGKTINLGRFETELDAYNVVKQYINAAPRLSN